MADKPRLTVRSRKVYLGFVDLNEDELKVLLDELKTYHEASPEMKKLLVRLERMTRDAEGMIVEKGIDLGPLNVRICPCCGK